MSESENTPETAKPLTVHGFCLGVESAELVQLNRWITRVQWGHGNNLEKIEKEARDNQ